MSNPAVSLPIPLKAASSAGVITEPQTTTIPIGGYSEVIGFGAMAVSLAIRLSGTADSSDIFQIQICDERTFTVPTTPDDFGLYDISSKAAGFVVSIPRLEYPGMFFRIFNDTSIALTAKYNYCDPKSA